MASSAAGTIPEPPNTRLTALPSPETAPAVAPSTMVCLALDLVGSWVVLGFSVGMEAFDELLSINVPWS